MKTRLAILLGILLVPGSLFAATHTATSCSAAAVQSIFNESSATGDTYVIPATGSPCHYTSQVLWTNPPADLTIHCLSTLSTVSATGTGIDGNPATIMLGNDDSVAMIDDYASSQPIMKISNITGTVRIYGCSWLKGNGSVKDSPGILSLDGTATSFRFDHNHINNTSGTPDNGTAAKFICLIGVADHNEINLNSEGTGNGIKVGGCGEGDAAWAAATDFGSANFLFFEDNATTGLGFAGNGHSNGALNDADHGARLVLRFNINGSTGAGGGVGAQTHPTGGSGPDARGARAYELYVNVFKGDNAHEQSNALFLSSGAAIAWGNPTPAGYEHFITLHSMRRNSDTYPESATPTGLGYCGTSFNGTGSNWDGNTNASTGYPCMDQPGRGIGDLLSGSAPTKVNTAQGNVIAYPRQALEPVYEFWNMPHACSGCDHGEFSSIYETDAIFADQDYYEHAGTGTINTSCPTGSTCTPFNGTTGTGYGPLSLRPTTCTTGVGYGVTDAPSSLGTTAWNDGSNAIYTGNLAFQKCTSTNTWTTTYVPYQYPHPLVSGSAPAASISSLTPSSGAQGATSLSVAVVGSNTNFVNATTVCYFGANITVNSCTVSSATALTASITISAGAATGARDATFTTGGEVATSSGGFTVNSGGIFIKKVAPRKFRKL